MWWNILMFNSFGGLKVWFFRQNIFFANDHYIRQYNELRRRFMTLGDVGRKKYFIGVLFHLGQKMRLGLWSMTFQTFCIFRTGYPYPTGIYFLWSFPKGYLNVNDSLVPESKKKRLLHTYTHIKQALKGVVSDSQKKLA